MFGLIYGDRSVICVGTEAAVDPGERRCIKLDRMY
jgi:hypothetical protein